MIAVLNAVLPVFLVMMTGWAVRKYVLPQQEFWQALDGLIFNLLLPALLLKLFSGMNMGQMQASLPMLGVIAASIFAVAALTMPARWMGMDGPHYSSYFQGATRTNFFISLSVGAALYGQAGLDLLALSMLALVPVNMGMSTYILARHGASAEAQTPAKTLKKLVVNPIIMAALIGLLINAFTGGSPPAFLTTTFEIFGRASLPLALLSIGAGLSVRCLKKPSTLAAGATFLKLIIHPLIVMGMAWYMGIGGLTLAVLMLVSAVPTAASSYTMARKMGGNANAMATTLTLQTLLALITLPLWIMLIQHMPK